MAFLYDIIGNDPTPYLAGAVMFCLFQIVARWATPKQQKDTVRGALSTAMLLQITRQLESIDQKITFDGPPLYVSPTGSKLHYSVNCGGLRGATTVKEIQLNFSQVGGVLNRVGAICSACATERLPFPSEHDT